MAELSRLLESNRAWADRMRREDPGFFERLAEQQAPEYLWIGCSDSRVPANQVVGMAPGEIFVHRNVANVVVHADLNCLATIQFAVDLLKVEHIIVCGHYGCSGVLAALSGRRVGIADNWLRHIGDVAQKHAKRLSTIDDERRRHRMLCELNVVEQVVNVCQTTVLEDAWARGQEVTVHGWIYGIEDGLVNELGIGVSSHADLDSAYENALAEIDALAASAS